MLELVRPRAVVLASALVCSALVSGCTIGTDPSAAPSFATKTTAAPQSTPSATPEVTTDIEPGVTDTLAALGPPTVGACRLVRSGDDFLGSGRIDIGWTATWPSEQGWSPDGPNTLVCWAWAPAPVSGSIQGIGDAALPVG